MLTVRNNRQATFLVGGISFPPAKRANGQLVPSETPVTEAQMESVSSDGGEALFRKGHLAIKEAAKVAPTQGPSVEPVKAQDPAPQSAPKPQAPGAQFNRDNRNQRR
jgi:hypothetical protein